MDVLLGEISRSFRLAGSDLSIDGMRSRDYIMCGPRSFWAFLRKLLLVCLLPLLVLLLIVSRLVYKVWKFILRRHADYKTRFIEGVLDSGRVLANSNMAARNTESIAPTNQEFHPGMPPAEPLTDKGHQIGKKVGNDAVPEFSAKTLPPGTAPKENTFQPNPVGEVPGQANNPDTEDSTRVDAQDTIIGATSADVHKGYGHPGQGEVSSELHHDGQHKRKRQPKGLAGVITGHNKGLNDDEEQDVENEDQVTDKPGKGPVSGRGIPPEGTETKMPVTS